MKIRFGFVSNSSSSSFNIYGIHGYDVDYEKVEKAGLEFHVCSPHHYIGLGWENVGDDETGAQFKKRVEKMIKDLFEEEDIEDLKFDTYSEAWYNG